MKSREAKPFYAITCKGRHFCPSCHQRRVRSTSEWIATAVCHEVPHRQFVFTIPKVLRGIFRKRRNLLTHLFHTVPAPPKRSARNLRPLWRNLILRVWSADPLICPCCKGLMRRRGQLQRTEEIEFFLRLHGMWEGIIDIPPPPEPPYDIETMKPLVCPFERLSERRIHPASSKVRLSHTEWQAPELPLDDERILVLDADPPPPDDFL